MDLGLPTWTTIGVLVYEGARALVPTVESGLDNPPGAGLLPSQASAPRAPVAVCAIH